MSFVRAPNPIWYMVDLTGLALNDNYWAFFLTNDLPYIPQPVYQDENGISPWSDPLQFQPSGTLPNNLYFDPTLVYRIEIRKGPTQNDPLIWLIENFVPEDAGGSSAASFNNSQNLVIDPQFADIDFSSPATFTVAGTYNIAPNWQLVLTGSGSTTLTQVTIAGSNNLTGNPPYALEITNSGWTTAMLVQTFNNNGALFANGSVAMSVFAKTSVNPYLVTLSYVPDGASNSQSVSGNTVVGVYTEIGGAFNVRASINSNVDGAANVSMTISLPTNDSFFITNVQFLGQSVLLPGILPIGDSPPFQELSYPQIVNQEFSVYRDSILYQPKNSLLTGWNFGNNPWQFSPIAQTNVAVNQYTADQTIIIQQNYVAAVTGNNISVGQDSVTNNYGFKVTAVTAHNEFSMLQWIDPSTIRQYWGQIVSSMVKASINTSHSSLVKFKMRLIYKAGLPNTTSQTDPISSWVENTDPVAAAGYTLIAPPNDPVYTLTATPTEFLFNGMVLPASSNADMTLGVIFYTISNMDQTATSDFITINDISLVRNDVALPTQPETFDETLRKCQYYYEKSYDNSILPGSASYDGVIFSEQFTRYVGAGTGTVTLIARAFGVEFNTLKSKIAPTINIYSPSGTVNRVQGNIFTAGASAGAAGDIDIADWVLFTTGQKSFSYVTNSVTATSYAIPNIVNTFPEAFILFHYTSNSCLGNPVLP